MANPKSKSTKTKSLKGETAKILKEKAITPDELAEQNRKLAKDATTEGMSTGDSRLAEAYTASQIPAKLRSVIATGGVLTPLNLMATIIEVRTEVLQNANRIPKFRAIADKLGAIETILIEELGVPKDDKQGELSIDNGSDLDQ